MVKKVVNRPLNPEERDRVCTNVSRAHSAIFTCISVLMALGGLGYQSQAPALWHLPRFVDAPNVLLFGSRIADRLQVLWERNIPPYVGDRRDILALKRLADTCPFRTSKLMSR